jgi:hypothetical protein
MEYIYNEEPEDIMAQLTIINDKVIADGSTGEMVTMMENKSINIADRIADCAAAILLKNARNMNEGLGKGKVNAANILQKGVTTHVRGIAQNGRSVLPTLSGLGDYGYNIFEGKKVIIPGKLPDLKILVVAINAKVISFTTPPCPFDPYLTNKEIVLTDDITDISDAVTLKFDAAVLRQTANGNTHDMAVLLEPSEINLRDFAAVIKELHGDDPGTAALYAFKTRNTSSVEKNQITKLLPTEFKTLENIAKLTLLVNNTALPLWVRKGKKRSGAYVILPANGTLLVTYGYGTCTIQNPSTTTPSELSATVNRKAVAA